MPFSVCVSERVPIFFLLRERGVEGLWGGGHQWHLVCVREDQFPFSREIRLEGPFGLVGVGEQCLLVCE